MSRVKNISGGPLDVPLLNRVVQDGETVDVPDSMGEGDNVVQIVWPDNRWKPMPDKAKAADSTDSKDAG